MVKKERSYFIEDRSNILAELIPRVKTTNNLLKADAYVSWNCVLPIQQRNYSLSKELKIPTCLLTHGVYGFEDNIDYIHDIHTPIRAVPILSDYYFAWGQLEVDKIPTHSPNKFPKKKIFKVGAPPMWESTYLYEAERVYLYKCINKKCEKPNVIQAIDGSVLKCESCGKTMENTGKAKIATQFTDGKEIIDPATREPWNLIEERHEILKQHPKAKWNLYIPSHDVYGRHMIHTRKNWEQIKHIPNLLVKASASYGSLGKKNPFKDVVGYKYCNKCDKLIQLKNNLAFDKEEKCKECNTNYMFMPKVTYGNINNVDNIKRMRRIISESKTIIIDYVSTPSLIAYAQDIPIITPLNDYGIRENGEVCNHISKADIAAPPDKIREIFEDVLAGKIDKKKERAEMAEYLGSVSKGFPAKNMKKILETL